MRTAAMRLAALAQRAAAVTDLYWIAHADDDGLWMDLQEANASVGRHAIHTVILTDMSTDGVYELLTGTGGVCPIHHVTHAYTMTRAQFTSYRDAEGQANAADMGGTYHIPSDRMVSGALTSAYCKTQMRAYAALYPGATHHALSWVDSFHPDHRATGFALRDLVDDSTIPIGRACFHLRTEDMAGNAGAEVIASVGAATLAETALAEYTIWNPGSNRYAIGYHGVQSLFDDQLSAAHNKTHTAAQNR
ncbi:MAG TPA: hypothetical protein VFI34_07690 [Candidatus Limnocylindrales bacterium]|nr:hypothetical protein [Candidatus Limnocylindrales bacterium]